jgi:hypothetical protein
MKKNCKRLKLHRETLHNLSTSSLRRAAGGSGGPACETVELSMCGVCPSDPLICDTWFDCGYTTGC